MKSLRRSLNSNGHAHGHAHSHSQSQNNAGPSAQGSYNSSGYGAGSSISPTGGATTFSNPLSRPQERVAPPQKVIKALASHRSTNPQELSYQQGDFWYVTGERDGWYEALNPISGSRGLVPKRDFEEFIKGGRQQNQHGSQGGSPTTQSSSDLNHEQHTRSLSGGQHTQAMRAAAAANMGAQAQSLPTTPGKKQPAPLYAIVQYDFHAERPDELQADAGEAIVVIAQSNHEWFVAKPIGRLGGPGLIPVSFVQIRDPNTGAPVSEFPTTIPQVEEWKKATAEYKAAAIPLGRLDLPPDQRVANSPWAAAAAASAAQHPQPSQVSTKTVSARTSSRMSAPQQRVSSRAASNHTARTGYRPEHDPMLPPGEMVQLGVPSFHNESGNYWFRLHALYMPDDQAQPAYTLILYRTYEDFYEFQISLLDTFPAEAGRPLPGHEDMTSPARILPYMPGPVDEAIDDELTEYRRDELDAYVRALLDLRQQGAGNVLRHELIRAFFSAKHGDYCEESPRHDAVEELAQRMGDVGVSPSKASHHLAYDQPPSPGQAHHVRASPAAQQQQLPGGYYHGRTGSSGGMPVAGGAWTSSPSAIAQSFPQAPTHTYGSSSGGSSTTRGTPGVLSPSTPASHLPPPTALRPAPQAQAQAHPRGAPLPPPPGPAPAAPNPRAGTAFIKIKIYDRATDDLIALRVHPQVTYAELLDKVRARLGPDVNVLQYRVGGGAVAANAPCRVISDDRGMAEWMAGEDGKLVLYAEQ